MSMTPASSPAAAAVPASCPSCPPCPPVPTFTFTHGFIVGQLSIVVLGLILIRFLVFEDTRAQALQRRSPFLNTAGATAAAAARKQQRRAALAASAHGGGPGGVGARGPAGANGPRNGAAAVAAAASGAAGASTTGAYAALWAAILDRTNYDISTHPSESTDWINVLFAQAIAGYREDAMAGGASMIAKIIGGGNAQRGASKLAQERGMVAAAAAAVLGAGTAGHTSGPPAQDEEAEGKRGRNARDLVQEALNFRITKANIDWLDPIHVIDVDFGEQFPTFSSARVRPADDTGRMRIEIDIDYNDQISLSIETKLVVNFPKPRFAVLPISLSLTVVRFSGTLALELFSTVPSIVLPTESASQASTSEGAQPTTTTATATAAPPPKPKCRHHLHISLHPDFVLEAHASSLIGSRAKLQDIPKIEQLLVARLRAFVHDRFVWPRFWAFGLPNLVPGPSLAAPAAAGAASASSSSGGGVAVQAAPGLDGTKQDPGPGAGAGAGAGLHPASHLGGASSAGQQQQQQQPMPMPMPMPMPPVGMAGMSAAHLGGGGSGGGARAAAAASSALPGSLYAPGLRRPGLAGRISTGGSQMLGGGVPEMTLGRGTEGR